jgi:hypothetical protein
VLGLISQVHKRQQRAFAVVLRGKLSPAQAGLQARLIVDELLEKAEAERLAPPVPPGAQPAAAQIQYDRAGLAQMRQAIEQQAGVSPRVKQMARVVMSQATRLNYSVWRTSAPLSDQAFIQYYVEETGRLGWGPPISKDETQPGRPTLLFQKPNNAGVVLIRAQPAPAAARPNGPLLPPSTFIYVLDMEGTINVASLRPK